MKSNRSEMKCDYIVLTYLFNGTFQMEITHRITSNLSNCRNRLDELIWFADESKTESSAENIKTSDVRNAIPLGKYTRQCLSSKCMCNIAICNRNR